MQICIDKKYDFDPDNGYIKVLCSILEGEEVLLSNIIAKPRPENFEEDLKDIISSVYAEFLSKEKEKQDKILIASKISEGSTYELSNEVVEEKCNILNTAE